MSTAIKISLGHHLAVVLGVVSMTRQDAFLSPLCRRILKVIVQTSKSIVRICNVEFAQISYPVIVSCTCVHIIPMCLNNYEAMMCYLACLEEVIILNHERASITDRGPRANLVFAEHCCPATNRSELSILSQCRP